MEQTTKLQQVLGILQKMGYSDEQIAQLSVEITKAAFSQLYTEALEAFTEADLQEVEACQDQKEADVKITQLYTQRTGKDAQKQLQQFIDNFAQGFLQEYQKDHPQ